MFKLFSIKFYGNPFSGFQAATSGHVEIFMIKLTARYLNLRYEIAKKIKLIPRQLQI